MKSTRRNFLKGILGSSMAVAVMPKLFEKNIELNELDKEKLLSEHDSWQINEDDSDIIKLMKLAESDHIHDRFITVKALENIKTGYLVNISKRFTVKKANNKSKFIGGAVEDIRKGQTGKIMICGSFEAKINTRKYKDIII